MALKIYDTVKAIDPKAWKKLESSNFPFQDFEFHLALEESGSVGGRSGWQSIILAMEDSAGEIRGLMPLFGKQHSYGEYIFDWQWARFFEANGIPYYPKIISAIPFTPANGPKILTLPGTTEHASRSALVRAAIELSRNSRVSSFHALFLQPDDLSACLENGMKERHSLQFHWKNEGFRDFQDFLDSFTGKRRRDISRERQRAQTKDLEIQCLSGSDLDDSHGEILYQLYRSTTDKKEAIDYLSKEFFQHIIHTMKDRILFVQAKRGDKIIAGALNFFKGDKLYGRYWGALEAAPHLHFELCYYQAIEFAITRGIQIFEAGAQGEHKVQRGFRPTLIHSAHLLFSQKLSPPIESFLLEESLAVQEGMRQYSSPFKGT